VALFKNEELLPSDIPFTEDKIKSYCQALVFAGKGKTLMMGIPGNMLEMAHTHILDMAMPIAMLKNAQPKS